MIGWASILWLSVASAAPAAEASLENVSTTHAAPYAGTMDSPPALHWRRRLPGGRSASATHTERAGAVIIGDRMLVGASAGSALYALSRRDGSVQATYPASESVESKPLVHGQRVYFSDTAGDTYCYTLDGELVWKHDGRNPILVQPQLYVGNNATPSEAGTDVNSVIYTTDVEDLAIALDSETGALLWRYEHRKDPTRRSQLALYAAPQAVVLDSGQVLFGFSDGSVVALNAETGDTNWTKRVGEGAYPDIVSTPVAYGTDLFVAGYYGPLVAMDRSDQSVRWRVDAGAAATPTLDSALGVMFHPGSDGILRSVSALTGDVLWTWDSETGGALTQPVKTEAGLFVGMAEGGLALIHPETGEQLWRFVGDFILQGVTATPTVDGRQLILITNAGYIYSFVRP